MAERKIKIINLKQKEYKLMVNLEASNFSFSVQVGVLLFILNLSCLIVAKPNTYRGKCLFFYLFITIQIWKTITIIKKA